MAETFSGGQVPLQVDEVLPAQQLLLQLGAALVEDRGQLGSHLAGGLAVGLAPLAVLALGGLVVRVEHAGIGEQALDLDGDGQRLTAAVPQLTPDGGHIHQRGVLLLGLGLEALVLPALEPEQTQEDQQDPEGHPTHEPRQAAIQQVLRLVPAQEAPGHAGLGGEAIEHGAAGAG